MTGSAASPESITADLAELSPRIDLERLWLWIPGSRPSAAPRNDEIKIRSRGAIFCRRCRLANFFAPRMSLSRRSGDFGFFLSLAGKAERKRNAGRR
jgi:hypothetical protein